MTPLVLATEFKLMKQPGYRTQPSSHEYSQWATTGTRDKAKLLLCIVYQAINTTTCHIVQNDPNNFLTEFFNRLCDNVLSMTDYTMNLLLKKIITFCLHHQ